MSNGADGEKNAGVSLEKPTTSNSNKEDNVCRVGVRLPPFWPEKPQLWFAQVEGNFVLSGITADETKFYFVISQLDHRFAAEVEDIIVSPPASGKYDLLKTQLIKRLSASKERKVKQLLMHEELGDRKPSQFLRHLQDLAGPDVPSDFIRTLWTNRLPVNLQTTIVSQQDMELDKLADLADKVHEAVTMSPHVATTSAAGPSTNLMLLSKQIAELTYRAFQKNLDTSHVMDNKLCLLKELF